ncbi:MAG: DNA/RNA nuclease SfsA [Treponema sp.]|jgi:sugar fermentation stimulation protein A|nr:DNA/RNA nuclease SfsA [Treponema sp.]
MADKKALSVKLFRNDREALFVERPNRFLIIAGDEKPKAVPAGSSPAKAAPARIPCHCPNPGRLIEFFGYRGSDIPGARLILEKRDAGAKAKTGWTAVGIYYRTGVAPLFSARANKAVEELALREIIPGITEVRGEFTLGDSRFDFLCVDREGIRHLVEVKACSLVEYGAAMFPDAPSERALKHLEELAVLCAQGYRCHVLFVIVHGEPERFIPNLHTDPQFAAALSVHGHGAELPKTGNVPKAAGRKKAADSGKGKGGPVAIHACLLRCDNRGTAYLARPRVPVDLSHGALAAGNGGSYMLMLEIPQARDTVIGALGTLHFDAGWYIYAGSARKNLSKRISRHLRHVRKTRRWHIDYLGALAERIKAYPILSYRNLECDLASALEDLGGRGVPRFGSSDCRCKSHLFYFRDPPLKNPAFIDLLLRFRHVEAFKKLIEN